MTQWFVPGRLELFGKHTDYAGGNALVAAVDRGVAVSVRPASEGFVAYSDHGPLVELDPAVDPGLPTGHWGRYLHTVLRRLTADFGPLAPAEIAVSSNLPLASGMSSSSALLTGVALTVIDANGIRETDEWRSAITSEMDLIAYLACVENGSGFKHLAGGLGVGTHGGSEDHAAILSGKPDHLLHLNFNPMRLVSPVRLPDGWQLMVATSGVLAEKTGAALADYNRCSAQVREIVARAEQRSDLALANLAAVVEMQGTDWARDLVGDSPALSRRLEHYVVESDRLVPEAVRALTDADRSLLGAVAQQSQAAAETLLGNQIPETSQLVRSALSVGAWAASSFGAGFGGSAWAVIPYGQDDEFAEQWLMHYRERFPEAGARAIALGVTPSGAARRIE